MRRVLAFFSVTWEQSTTTTAERARARVYCTHREVWRSVDRFFETPHDNPPECALMLTAYLDESRHDDPSSYMVVAGFWGKKEQWEALAADWIVSLGNRKSLHMKTLRLNSERGAKRARAFLPKMGALPHKHGLTPTYCAVKTGDYIDLVVGTYLKAQLPGYVICLTGVMQQMSRRISGAESIKLVCEMQQRYQGVATNSFVQVARADPLSRPNRPYFSGIEFIPKNSSVLTQPSDFLAYAVAEWRANPSSPKMQLCMPILGAPGTTRGLVIPREEIRRMVTGVKNSRMYKIITGTA